MQTMESLIQALVDERTQRIMDYDDAYPDVGMGKASWVARREAIQALITEGKIPPSYKE
jgi:hypothetical protein